MVRASLDDVRRRVVGIDAEVTLLDGSKRPYINFDNASTTPCLGRVFERTAEFLRWYGSVGRGAGFKSDVSTAAMSDARASLASFVGADLAAHTVIFTKNTTEALNKLAHRFPFAAGDVVLCSLMEHHSNDLPWRAAAEVERIGIDRTGRLDLMHLERQLGKLGGRVRLVGVTGGSNVTGYINPIHDIAEMAHAAGAQVVVDAAQLAAHRTIQMGPAGGARSIDYLAFAGHKMYAPFGVGVLVGLKEAFLSYDFDMVGGGTVDLVTLNDTQWSGLPAREEAGSLNAVGIVALAEAAWCLQEIGLDRIAEHEAALTARFLRGLHEIDGIIVHGDDDPDRATERLGVVPFEVRGMPHQLVAAILAAEGGIGVRTGLFCSHPYMLEVMDYGTARVAGLKKELAAGVRAKLPGFTRVSFGLYNTELEVDALLDLLVRLASGRYAGEYTQDLASGAFHAKGHARGVEDAFALGR